MADETAGKAGRAEGEPVPARRPVRRGLVIALALLLILGGLGVYGMLVARSALQHAGAARADLQRVMDGAERARSGGIDRQTVIGLRDDLAAAERNLAGLQGDLDALGPAVWLAGRMPGIGPRVRADAELVRAAVRFARAGRQVADVAVTVYGGLEQGGGQDRGRVVAALAAGGPSVVAARDDYRAGLVHLAAVDRAQIEPELRPTLAMLDRQLPQLNALVEGAADLVPVLPSLLGQEREVTYLLLMQDPGELRPTGGFIGNYGLVKVRNGAVVSTVFQDVYLVDLPYLAAKRPLPHPFDRYFPQATAWGLRDSNAWPDFPTSARAAIDLAVAEGIAPQIDGVIAITPETVSRLLNVVGPVQVPEYNATVDAGNVDSQIRYYQYDEAPNDPQQFVGRDVPYNVARKRFTALLALEVAARLQALPAERFPALAKESKALLERRAVQVYLADATAQQTLVALGLDGGLHVGEGDFLWPVETNIGANKADLYVARNLTYAVQLAADGSAGATLQLGYEFTPTGKLYNDFGYDYFRAYVAVYRPPGARLVSPAAATDRWQEGGSAVDGRLLEVRPGEIGRLTLTYEQAGAAQRQVDGSYRYQLRLPRQAGGTWRGHTLAITLPPGAVPVSLPEGAQLIDRTVVLTQVPIVDLQIAIVYTLP